MLVMRPAQMADLGTEVQRLAADSPVGVTSPPDDSGTPGDKIAASKRASPPPKSASTVKKAVFRALKTATGTPGGLLRPSSPRPVTRSRFTASVTKPSCTTPRAEDP